MTVASNANGPGIDLGDSIPPDSIGALKQLRENAILPPVVQP